MEVPVSLHSCQCVVVVDKDDDNDTDNDDCHPSECEVAHYSFNFHHLKSNDIEHFSCAC